MFCLSGSVVLAMSMAGAVEAGGSKFQSDAVPTSAGELKITFIGHGTLMFEFGGKIIHLDPWTKLADYDALPKADLILVTHTHPDHLDPAAVEKLTGSGTKILLTRAASEALGGKGQVMKNGDRAEEAGIGIEAVPAYNIAHTREPGKPFHPMGEANGYVLTFGDKRVYAAADTENTPEMKALKGIDIAFLPMNLPYTMTPEMVADAARAFRPKVLYPYHYGDTNVQALLDLLKGEPGIEVRIRNLK